MLNTKRIRRTLFLSIVLVLSLSPAAFGQKKKPQKPKKVLPTGTPVIWRDPGDISARDLKYGPGSADLAPVAPFTFIREETTQTSPKFRVRDAKGVTWTVKLGVEAQAETVSTRLLWAMGYFAEENYYMDRVQINNLTRLSRGQEFVESGGFVRGARFEPKRPEQIRGQIWDWLQNPFLGQKEFEGLKVLMVLLANYDTRLDNNRIIYQKNEAGQMEARYVVADIGATLGHVGGLGGQRAKNSLQDFLQTKFIIGVQNGVVEFDYSTKPKGAGGAFASIFGGGYAKRQANKEKAMRRIPVESARWMGQQLSRLSDDQLRDAFRSAGYDNATMEGFVKTLRERINMLANLS